MDQYGLEEATWEQEGERVSFRRKPTPVMVAGHSVVAGAVEADEAEAEFAEAAPAAPVGNPITSPMNGIYYGSPSPSAPPFVKEGETVSAGQIIGLIEAMKVFNEVPSPFSGTVLKVVAESGSLVQPGDALILIG